MALHSPEVGVHRNTRVQCGPEPRFFQNANRHSAFLYRSSVRSPVMARYKPARVDPRYRSRYGLVASLPGPSQYLGACRSRGVLEVRGKATPDGRRAWNVSFERFEFF